MREKEMNEFYLIVVRNFLLTKVVRTPKKFKLE